MTFCVPNNPSDYLDLPTPVRHIPGTIRRSFRPVSLQLSVLQPWIPSLLSIWTDGRSSQHTSRTATFLLQGRLMNERNGQNRRSGNRAKVGNNMTSFVFVHRVALSRKSSANQLRAWTANAILFTTSCLGLQSQAFMVSETSSVDTFGVYSTSILLH